MRWRRTSASVAQAAHSGLGVVMYNPQSANRERARDIADEMRNYDLIGLIGTQQTSQQVGPVVPWVTCLLKELSSVRLANSGFLQRHEPQVAMAMVPVLVLARAPALAPAQAQVLVLVLVLVLPPHHPL